MNRVQKIALLYLLVMLVGFYGYSVGRFKVFPYEMLESLVQDYQKFARGDEMEKKTSVVAKLKNDLGISYDRWLYLYPELAAAKTVPAPYPALGKRKDAPLVYVNESHRSGYRVIFGALELQDSFWGALLLNPDGEIIHSWNLSTLHLPAEAPSDQMKNLYGVHLFPDGSIIFVMQERGGGIVKVDACSNVIWSLEGEYHHTIEPDDQGYFWSFIGKQNHFDQNMVRISIETGEPQRVIDMAEVRKANPDLHIWDLFRYTIYGREKLRKTGNMSHGNDIEPLPRELAENFPQFETGDLLISYATTNHIFILDPDTLKVKWWRIGLGDLQHDPDWEPDGRITLFSNNARSVKPHSDIVTVDPANMAHEVTLEGADFEFKSTINGRHQLTPQGTRFVTSSQQGWAFEVDPGGNIVFSFLNSIDTDEGKALHLSEALRYEEGYFSTEFWESCAQ